LFVIFLLLHVFTSLHLFLPFFVTSSRPSHGAPGVRPERALAAAALSGGGGGGGEGGGMFRSRELARNTGSHILTCERCMASW